MDPRQLKRWIRALWLTGAAAVLATAAAAWWLGDQHTRNHRDNGPVFGDVLVSGDGRTITTTAMWTPCHAQRPQLRAHESPEMVTLVIRESTANLQQQCDSADQQITTTIASPLGSRPLIDASTGRTITPFDGSELATPRYLPVGYEPSEEIYDEPPDERCLPSPFERAESASWSRFYRKGFGHPSLAVAQIAKETPDDPRGAIASVDGHTAHLQEHSASRCLTWSSDTYTYVVATRSAQLTTDELLRIAKRLSR
ncbi:hypothetical protein [Streptomyces orinoci]|uniref:DUF4367 domain-containing protein n=1 Tax=Streptomyces orinoci TaxID=67339 RepID=A0ABV3JYA9_STRON|nr:hypothetical protein [Streptomyces orinoci]